MSTILDKVKQEILKWPDVTSDLHRFGGIEFCITSGRAGSRGIEMGHIHGNRLADLPFPMQIRNELINSGRVSPHHIMPQSGWVSYWIRGGEEAKEKEIAAVIDLFRMQYNRLHHSNYKQGTYKA
jgi:hypothetical protein